MSTVPGLFGTVGRSTTGLAGEFGVTLTYCYDLRLPTYPSVNSRANSPMISCCARFVGKCVAPLWNSLIPIVIVWTSSWKKSIFGPRWSCNISMTRGYESFGSSSRQESLYCAYQGNNQKDLQRPYVSVQ